MTANAPEEGRPPRRSQLLIFGDLSLPHVEEQLHRLLHVKNNPLLASFFDRVNYSLRRLVEALPASQQNLFPRFTTLIDLLSRLGETASNAVLNFFLLSVHQVAQCIVYFTEASSPFPPPPNTYVVGPCTGGFAAAAVSFSPSLSALVSNGVESVFAAFRTALRSFLVGQSVSGQAQRAHSNKSWSAVLNVQDNADLKQLLDEYANAKASSPIPPSCRQMMLMHGLQIPLHNSALWVSAITSDKTTTLSGCPSVLQNFVATNTARFKSRYLEIESPYHAAHLFSDADLDLIVGDALGTDGEAVALQTPMLSSSTGKIIAAHSFTDLLRTVVREALRDPVRWDLVLESFRGLMAHAHQLTILPFSSNASSMVSSALAKHTSVQVSIKDVLSFQAAGRVPHTHATGRFEDSKIAIIGYSGRFPSADSNHAFWELLRAGRDVHREIPPDRFDWKTHFDLSGKTKNTSRVKYGCFIDEPGMFDARFFNISPREAENTDPAQRLALTTTYEAMEMAGMVLNRTPSTQQDRVGVFFGTTSDDWREVNSAQDIGTYFVPGGNRAFVPGRMSYFFRFSGPSLSIDTACSSSFAAIQVACSYLWKGECDTAVAGGTNVLTNPDNFAGLDRGHFLSTTGNCNTFDDEASGYCRSDAVGSVILKRLEDAEADKDPIFAVIVGTNTNHCGQTDSITRPHEGDQASVFKRVMRYADVNPLDVGYIEMHGTGTQAGDATEMKSVLSVFVPEYKRMSVQPTRPLYLGSAKANIGHAESASGVSSLIKVLMMMKHSEIPPHCGIKSKINHHYPLDLAQRGVRIAMETTPWRRQDAASRRRRVFLNNFSAAGGNTAILLEDAPERGSTMEKDPRPFHVVTVTAKSPKSLVSNINSLVSFLEKNRSVSLAALSYTTTARRIHHPYRVVVSGSDIESTLSALKSRAAENQAAQDDLQAVPTSAKKRPRVIFMFAGQGNLYTEMGKSLFVNNAVFRASILQLNHLATAQGFPPCLGLVDGSITTVDHQSIGTVVSQLALVCVQIALFELWKSWGVEPAVVVGHSLGEYPALHAAGVLSAADVIYLVGTRAKLLEECCFSGTHTMLVVKGSMEVLKELLHNSEGCEWACANEPSRHVLAGPEGKISKVASAATDMGIQTVPLNVPYAFHSAQVEPILAKFELAATQGVTYCPPTIPFLSPLLATMIPAGHDKTLNASYLTAACRGRVDYMGAIAAAATAPADGNILGPEGIERAIWVDIGLQPVCSSMIKGTLGSHMKTVASMRQKEDPYETLTTSLKALYLAGIELSWNEYHRDFPAAQEVLQLPMYAWDLKNYWIQYRNDFCLTKGDGTAQQSALEESTVPATVPKYLSPCAQQIVEESHGIEQSSLVVESDIFDPRLLPVLHGHLVNGAALCPSVIQQSMYADVALTLADYMLLQCPNKLDTATTGLDVANVHVENPLIARPNETSHHFRASATTEWASYIISMAIFSVDSKGQRTSMHATLDVHVVPEQRWLHEWKRNAHLITARVDSLAQSVHGHDGNQDCNLIKRGMAYKLFSALVQYSKEYQGMAEVIMNSTRLEAVSTVKFQVEREGFYLNPKWIDSLGHVAGFIMNANDGVDSQSLVFINHGWERMRIAQPLESGKTYQAYNRMQLVEKTTYAGDTYILESDRIVALFEGVKFQGVPRRVLDHLLPSKSSTAITKSLASHNEFTLSKFAPATTARSTARLPVPITMVAEINPVVATSTSAISQILKLIAEEVGVELSDLTANCEFAQLGVDSLSSLTITSKIRDQLGLDFPPSLFIDHPTVGDLRGLVCREDSASASTPNSQLTSSGNSVYKGSSQDVLLSLRTRDALVLRQIISEETRVSVDELKPPKALNDIGLDSLLGLTIAAKLNEVFGLDIPGSIFLESETLQDVTDRLFEILGLNPPSQEVPVEPVLDNHGTTDSSGFLISPPNPLHQTVAEPSLPQATSILLSGTPQTARTIFFLFPDGSGSASSYAALAPCIDSSRIAVYGLNCPWRKTAAEMTRLRVTMSTMVARYVAEMRRLLQQVQRASPPLIALGGWSAGGILAFEAVRQLQDAPAAIQVSQLVLFDSPNPIGLQNPPQRMYDFFESLGIFGGGKTKIPDWLRAHFDAFIRILDAYEPIPIFHPPTALMVYASDGVCKDPLGPKMETYPDDPREMLWLLNNRTDFSADGWASVLGRNNLSVRVLEEVNHFSLMDAGPKMKEMGEIVSKFLLSGLP